MVKNLCKVLVVRGIWSFLKGKKGYIYEPRIGNRLFSKIIYFLEEVVKGIGWQRVSALLITWFQKVDDLVKGFPSKPFRERALDFSSHPTLSYRKRGLRTFSQTLFQSLEQGLTDFGQRPPFIRFLVWLSSLCPFGVRHDLFMAVATGRLNLIPC